MQEKCGSCKVTPSAYSERMTSCGPRLKKTMILEKTCEIAIVMHSRSARDKGKRLVTLDNVNTRVGNELSSGSFPSLNLSSTKNTRESTRTRSIKRPSPHPTFSDAVSGASSKARKEAGKRQYLSGQAPGNPSVLLTSMWPPVTPVHSAFGVTPMFYTPLEALIWGPNVMLSSPLRKHILDYDPPHGFVIPTFT